MRTDVFENPGSEWRGKPFWSWNGELREKELLRQADVFRQMGFGGYFMHSRCGLITEYLGDEWFALTNSLADKGAASGLEAWLYDEDRWPSGSAGGKVTEDESLRMQSLVYHEADSFTWQPGVLFAFEADTDGLTLNSYRMLERGEYPVRGKAIWFTTEKDAPSGNYNGNTYTDTMNLRATQRFIELTHDKYAEKCGSRLGTSIPGIFTDEPHRGACMGYSKAENGVRTDLLFWTDDIFDEFLSRYGYDIKPLLPEIFLRYKGEPVSKPRMDYLDLGCNLFNERFAVPIHEWCRSHNISFTGHVLHEDMLSTQTAPNGSLMRFYANMDIPGIDILSNRNTCYQAAVQCRSVCRQTGKTRMLSELYGCTGWEFDLRRHRNLGAWQALLGVNLRCPHLAWYTMEGECKRDYPASISFQSAWYAEYANVEDLFARMGYLLSFGSPVCDLLVINPIESVWALAHTGWAQWIFPQDDAIKRLEEIYTDTCNTLLGSRTDFDYGEEQMLAQMYSAGRDGLGAYIKVGQAIYREVLIRGLVTIRSTTVGILREIISLGVRVIFCGDTPAYVDGGRSDLCAGIDGAEYITDLKDYTSRKVSHVLCTAPDSVFMQLRRDGASLICVLLNMDEDKPSGSFELSADESAYRRAEFWDMETGTRYLYADKASVTLELYPGQAAAIVFTNSTEPLPGYCAELPPVSGEISDGEFSYRLSEPNVCVLDYCRLSLDGAPFGKPDEVLKIDSMIRDILGIERRGGEMLQPWFAKTKFTETLADVTLVYPFIIDEVPASPVYLAGERPENLEYYVNDVRVTPDSSGDFWVDNAFVKMPVPLDALKTGENTVTVRCAFKRTTNTEAVYLLGDFGVKACAGSSHITAKDAVLPLTNIQKRSLPFYGGRVTITIPFEQYSASIRPDARRVLVRLAEYDGACVTVNGQAVLWEPYSCDITNAYSACKALEITLVNTRRNTFGPLHLVPALQNGYGPGHFVTSSSEWSDDYAQVPSGFGRIEFLS